MKLQSRFKFPKTAGTSGVAAAGDGRAPAPLRDCGVRGHVCQFQSGVMPPYSKAGRTRSRAFFLLDKVLRRAHDKIIKQTGLRAGTKLHVRRHGNSNT